MGGWLEYLVLILLVLLNAFFAASELAIVSARKTRIRHMAESGHRKVSTPTVTQEEVVSMVTVGQEEGVFHPQQEELIRSVFDFSEKRVREVMVPRPDMVMLDAALGLEEAVREMLESDYSRYPV